jgi:FkbM family methyltransferase
MDDFRQAFDKFARQSGYVLTTSPGIVLNLLRPQVDEVLDIGVRKGTPFLYNSFPDATFFLIDPQEGGEADLRIRPKTFRFLNVAVGREAGKLTIHEHEEGAKSSLLERTSLTQGQIRKSYTVPVQTIDEIIRNNCKSDRIGIKLDTEGYELEAILGFNATCERVRFLIAEVSVKDRFVNGYTFGELIAALMQRGFRFYNILNPARRKAPLFYDCIFFRHDDLLFRV